MIVKQSRLLALDWHSTAFLRSIIWGLKAFLCWCRWLNPLAVEALCGALGEMTQTFVLYPMDTLKIQCQAHSLGSKAAWASIVSKHAGPGQLMRSMYAGCGSQVVCSAAIGAVYLVSFFQLKQMFRRWAYLLAQPLVWGPHVRHHAPAQHCMLLVSSFCACSCLLAH